MTVLAYSQILTRVNLLADGLSDLLAELSSAGKEVTVLIVMNGAFRFASDLISFLPDSQRPLIDFVTLSNYKGSTGRTPTHVAGPSFSVQNRHVVVIEDIVDRGDTMVFLRQHLVGLGADSLSLISLLARERTPRLLGFSRIEYGFVLSNDLFVLGYGLDYAGYFRTLNDIVTTDDVVLPEEVEVHYA